MTRLEKAADHASIAENRYVWDCEFWEPDVDKVDMSEKRVHKTDKSIHEPVCFLRETSWSDEIASWDDPNGFPVYTAPPQKEWVDLTQDEMIECHREADFRKTYKNISAKLREKNS